MKRFLKVFVLLIVSLFVLVSGLDHALDTLSRSSSQNNYVWYSQKGEVVLAYTGDLTSLHSGAKLITVTPPTLLHRG